MPKAIWNGVTIADSDDTVVVEGNHYFRVDAVDPALLKPSSTTTTGTTHTNPAKPDRGGVRRMSSP